MTLALDIANVVDLETPVAQAGALRLDGHVVGATLDSMVEIVSVIYDSTHQG